MDPNVYVLLEPALCIAPDIYPNFATLAMIKMTDAIFEQSKNY